MKIYTISILKPQIAHAVNTQVFSHVMHGCDDNIIFYEKNIIFMIDGITEYLLAKT
jgi:hypothetical protein